MRVVIPGHVYEVETAGSPHRECQTIKFVRKEPAREGSEILQVKATGTTNEEIFAVMINRMEFLQGKMPCDENAEVIDLLKQCADLLHKRTLNRQSRGVEGTHKE